MTRNTFLLAVRHLLDEVEDQGNILVNAMELMDELYALIDRPGKYRRELIREWALAEDAEIQQLSKLLATDIGILKYLDNTLHYLAEENLIQYKNEINESM